MINIKKIKKHIMFLFILGAMALAIFLLTKYFIHNVYFKRRSISMLAWIGTFSPETIEQFEKEHNIDVNISYYSSNEELIAKIFLTKAEGIDIIVPSDYALSLLEKDGLLAEIDKTKINDYKILYPFLLYENGKKNNIMAIPIEWGVYGLAYRKELSDIITSPALCTEAFFNGRLDKKTFSLCVMNDILAACNVTWNYYTNLFTNNVPDTKAVASIIYELLRKQFPYVCIYSDTNITPLFKTKSIDIAYLQSDEYIRSLKQINEADVIFVLPEGNIVKTVEYIAFSKKIKNIDEAYEFINFILSPDINIHNVTHLGYFPVRKDIINNELIHPKAKEIMTQIIEKKQNNLKHIELILNDKEQVGLWMKLKS